MIAVASIDEPVLNVMSTRNGKLIKSFKAGPSDIWGIWGIAFSPDSKLIAVCTEESVEERHGKIRVWNVSSSKLLTEIVDEEVWGITAVAFSPGGLTLAAGKPSGELQFFAVSNNAPRSGTP